MSFSAEIKDFIGGFQAGAQVGGDIQDRKLAREKWEWDKAFEEKKYGETSARADRALDLREQSLFDRQKARSAREAERKLRAAEKKAEAEHKAEVKDFNILAGEGPGSSKSTKPTYSDEYDFDDGFGSSDEYDYEDVESALPVEGVDSEEVGAYAAGGMVPPQVEDEEHPELAAEEAKASAIPVEETSPEAEPDEPEVVPEGKGDLLLEQVKEPIRDVMGTWTKESKEPKTKPAAIEEKPKKIQDRVSDVKPATPEEIKAIDAVVDPNGEMAPYRKGAARLVKAYNFFVEKGDPGKARKIAAQIIKYDHMASMTLGKLAQAAAEQNDLVSASQLLTDAYNENIPDGNTLTAEPTPKGTVLFKIERDGKTVQQGEATTRQLWEMAGKVADGSEFIKRMARIAGEGTSGGNTPGGKKRRSYPADIRSAAQAVLEVERLQDELENPELSEEQLTAVREQFTAKRAEAEKLMKIAEQARVKTNRPMEVFEKDFLAAKKAAKGMALPSALPEEPAEESGWWGRNMPTWLGGDEEAAPAAPQSAIPADAPAAPAAPVTSPGKPLPDDLRAKAQAAIDEGRSRAGVIKKLQDAGYSTEGL